VMRAARPRGSLYLPFFSSSVRWASFFMPAFLMGKCIWRPIMMTNDSGNCLMAQSCRAWLHQGETVSSNPIRATAFRA